MKEKSLYTYLRERAAAAPDALFLADAGSELTAGEALPLVQGTAARLAELGVAPGTLVALRCTRRAETALLFVTLTCMGAVAVLTGPHQTVEEFLAAAGDAVPAAFALTDEGGSWTLTCRRSGRAAPVALTGSRVPLDEPDPGAPAVILFTSGSTGPGKAVVLSQANLIADLEDTRDLGDYRAGDVALGVIPLEHVFGQVLLVGTLVVGYALYLVEKPHIPTILQAVQDRRITRMNGVPTLYLAMAAQREGYDLSSLRCGFIGGGPWTREQFDAAEAALDMTLIPAYGMTECVGISCASWQDAREVRGAGVGRFYPTDRAGIFRPDGSAAPVGEEGEIWVDGPTRMLGYYGGGGVDEQGFVHTGDLGYLDPDGILHIVGRKKDIIIRSGVNLSPRRIEEAMLTVPGVREAAVVAMPHPALGEVPWAGAVCEAGVREADILSALTDLLHKNELPERVVLVDKLPTTASGKPDKQKLREELAKWQEA